MTRPHPRREPRAGVVLGAALASVLLLASSCTDAEPPPPSAAPATSAAPPTAAAAPPRPEPLQCRRLSFDDALSPTDDAAVVPCARPHTGQTFAVGLLDTTVEGHLVAVDSDRVRRQVARTCPRKLAAFLGAQEEDLRLSMLRAVWFTPSVEESDAGANWYRCDVVAVGGDDRLAPIRGSLRGVFGDGDRADAFAMCGTAAPDDPDFERVLCREDHTWRAITVVGLSERRYPGPARARAVGREPCNEAGREVADDVLDYEWGWEWPTREQWEAGQTYGRCWAPV